MTNITKHEMETIVNYSAGEQIAIVYTRDKKVMRKLDQFVRDYPGSHRLINQVKIDKFYSMPNNEKWSKCRSERRVKG